MAEPLADRREHRTAPPVQSLAPILLGGPIARDEVGGVVARVTRSMATSAPRPVVICAGGVDRPGLACVDAVAQLILAAHRARQTIRFADLSPEILDLVDLCGLAGLIAPVEPAVRGRADTATAEAAKADTRPADAGADAISAGEVVR